MSESCRTRFPGWSNLGVDWIDTVALMCTWERMGVLATSQGAPGITVEQFGRNNIFFGNTAGGPRNHSYYLSFKDF